MLEIIRRVLALGLVLGAVWTYVYTAPGIVRVRPLVPRDELESATWRSADEQRLMQRLLPGTAPAGLPAAPSSEQAIVKKLLAGSTIIPIHGAEWTSFADQAFATVDARPPFTAWRLRYGKDDLLNPLFFSPDEPPLDQVAGQLGRQTSSVYLSLSEAGRVRYIGISRMGIHDIMSQVPGWLAHPYREVSALLLLAAFLVYILLPWPRRNEAGTMTYARGSSVIGPDWLGIALAAVFFAIVLLAFADNTDAVLEPGWWLHITGWALLATIPWISLLIVGLWYTSFSLTIRQDSLRVVTLRRTDEMRFADIVETRMEPFTSPTWLKVLSTILVIVNLGRRAYILPLVYQQQPGLTLLGTDGRKIRLLIGHLPGYYALLQALQQHGVSLPDEAKRDLADADECSPEVKPPKSPVPGRIALGILICGLCLGIWLLTSRYSPTYRLPPIPEKQLTQAEVERMQQRHAVLLEAQSKVSEALQRYEKAPASERDAAYAEYQRAVDHFIKLGEMDK